MLLARRQIVGRRERHTPSVGSRHVLDPPPTCPGTAVSRHRIDLGARGEALAAEWYLANGYTILDRNWRCRAGELDLVVGSGRTVVFCEVKTRSSTAYGTPAEAVTRTKQLRIRRLAAEWLAQSEVRPASLRFDVAAVLSGRLEVIEAAF